MTARPASGLIFAFALAVILFPAPSVFAGPAEAEGEWKEHRSRHFHIYYKDTPRDFVRSVEDAAEGDYEEITRNLGFHRYQDWTFDERARIYIYRDQDDYMESSKQANWSHGAANAREKIIRTFPAAHGFFDSTLPHELGHIIFREFIGDRAVLPLWFEEGVAMYQEKAKRWGAHKIVSKAMAEGRFIPLGELSQTRLQKDSDRELVELFYNEAASVIYFLVTEQGNQRFLKFCQNLQEGKTFEQALNAAYGRFNTIEDLNRVWLGYLEKQ